ncbi:MAG: cystathionine beta-lyase [Desulfobacterales bacterium]|nr:cystathionine beta-lyase [Desulfobacterales bacterium]
MKQKTRLINYEDDYQVVNGKPVRTVNPPIYRGSTVLFEKYEDLLKANSGQYEGVAYGTAGLPTQRAFEDAIRVFEGGYLTRAFQSGISAIINTLMAFTKSGDHILVCDNVYGPTSHFCNKILTRYGVELNYVPPDIGADIDKHIKENTRLIFLESPGSNTFEIQDIPAITAIAKNRNILTVLDNTWATPLYLRPFDLGVDVSIQSITKYIAGHSDILLGTVTVNEKYAAEFDKFYNVMEIYASQDDCYLALRGLKTLPVRLKQHEKSAFEIAQWLESECIVGEVIHPALASHSAHHLWKRDFSGASGLFAFIFKQDYSDKEMAVFVNSLNLFGIGFSWGGFKSLITAGKCKRRFDSKYSDKTIIRLNIGLEETEDLIDDLKGAFAKIF